jgi:hypothetical protein
MARRVGTNRSAVDARMHLRVLAIGVRFDARRVGAIMGPIASRSIAS